MTDDKNNKLIQQKKILTQTKNNTKQNLKKQILNQQNQNSTIINSVQQLVDIIASLQQKLPKKETTTQTIFKNTKKSIIENLRKEAERIRENTKESFSNFLDIQPLYKKPAYYLDQFSPYCRMYLVYFEREDPNNLASPILEKQVAVIHDENFDINNFIKSININFISQNKDGGVIIELIDVQQDIADFLVAQISLIQNVAKSREAKRLNLTQVGVETVAYIKLQYGWYYNKLRPNINQSEIKDVIFQNSIYVSINDINVSFSAGGIPQVTIKGSYNLNFPGPYMHLSPFNVLGTYPILPLCLKEIYDILDDVMQYFIIPNINNTQYIKRAILFVLSILNAKQIKDKTVLKNIVSAYFKYYSTLNAKNSGLLGYIPTIFQIINTEVIPVYNQSFYDFRNILLKKYNSGINKIIKLLQEEENFNYSAYFLNMLLNANLPNKHEYYMYIGNLGIALLDNAKIHPYIAYKYLYKIFMQKIKQFDELNAKPKVISIFLEMFEIIENDILPIPNDWLTNIDYVPNTSDLEKYYINANKVITYSNTSWHSLLDNYLRATYVAIPNTALNREIYGNDVHTIKINATAENKKKYNTITGKIDYIPKNLCLAQLQCDKLGAENNLKILKKLLERRIEILNTQLTSINEHIKKFKSKYSFEYITLSDQQKELKYKTQFTKTLLTKINTYQCIDDALYIIYILDFIYASDFLTPDILKTNIVQCYSHNISGIYEKDYNGYYNPGIPNCLSVNFPDVLEFNTDMNYAYSVSQLFQLRFTTGERYIGVKKIEQITQLRLNEYLQEATIIYNDSTITLEDKIKQLNDILKNINILNGNEEDTSPIVNSLVPLEPLTINIRSFTDGRIYNGDYEHILQYKKNLQELRKRILLTSIPAQATLKIIGDASFTMNDIIGKYIFLKVTNIDGSLSPFTGLYLITDITHSISNTFTTELKLTSAFKDMIGDTKESRDRREAFYKMIYSVDKQIIQKIR